MSTSAGTDSDHRYERAVEWAPYVLLLVSTAIVSIDQSWTERAITAGLSAVAAGWVFVMFTRPGLARGGRQEQVRIYFAGLLVIAAVMMAHSVLYFVFAITGLLHSSLLRPSKVMVIGLAASSLVVNSGLLALPEPTVGSVSIYLIVVIIQTAAIAFGILGSQRVAELSEQRQRTVAELEAALEENAGLHAQLVAQAREAGVLDERQRMAGEIHDTIAQALTGVIIQLEAAQQALGDQTELQRHVDNATQLARDSLAEARRSVHALRPAALDGGQMPSVLADVAQRWSALNGVAVEVATTGQPRWLHPEIEVTLLRVTQEALANVAKHAGASRVGVTLSYMGELVTLDVRDDGAGLVQDRPPDGVGTGGGFGLTAMRQRVERLSGRLDIESEPGGGTAISAHIPAGLAEATDG